MSRWISAMLTLLVPAMGAAQSTMVAGRLHLIWDGERTTESAQYYIAPSDGGSAIRILPTSPAQSAELDGLDRRQVQVALRPITSPRASERRAELLSVMAADAGEPAIGEANTLSSEPYNFATLLCRFADIPFRFTREQAAVPYASSFPGVRYHFKEMSRNNQIMAGNAVFGEFTLPLPMSAYTIGNSVDFWLVARDCTAAADASVDFSGFYGINLQLSGDYPYSWGGSMTLALDGQTRVWGLTWLSHWAWNSYGVLVHEVGHALGWPHSSGEYLNDYDSKWDVMSNSSARWEPPWGWRGTHTIMPHKIAAGWISPDRVWRPGQTGVHALRLARSAFSPEAGYQAIELPVSWDRRFVMEARIPTGLDVGIPGAAVIIHEVRGGIRSYVVDPDWNGDPNDAGAQWLPGETFVHQASLFRMRVDAIDDEGVNVTVMLGAPVTVNTTGGGTVVVTREGADATTCSVTCTVFSPAVGLPIRLQASANEGQRFVQWTGSCLGTAPTCELLTTNEVTVGALFAAPPVIGTTSLSPGMMGANYTQVLQAEVSSGVLTWRLVSGALPPGLTLDGEAGRITGVALASGRFDFTVQAEVYGLTSEQQVSLVIDRPQLSVQAVLDLLFGTAPNEDHRRFLDLVGNRNFRLDIGDVRAWLLTAEHLTAEERASVIQILPPAPRAPQ